VKKVAAKHVLDQEWSGGIIQWSWTNSR